MNMSKRFWEKVDKENFLPCWKWTAYLDKDGYGHLRQDKTFVPAHRYSYELNKHRSIPKGLLVRHSCNHPWCVNPAHLKTGTHLQNMHDRKMAGNYFTGEKHFASKITSDDAIRIKELINTELSVPKIALITGTTRHIVAAIKRNETWKNV